MGPYIHATLLSTLDANACQRREELYVLFTLSALSRRRWIIFPHGGYCGFVTPVCSSLRDTDRLIFDFAVT